MAVEMPCMVIVEVPHTVMSAVEARSKSQHPLSRTYWTVHLLDCACMHSHVKPLFHVTLYMHYVAYYMCVHAMKS